MLKIGTFSKLSHLTVKALRFYEKEGILMPASTDPWTGYRLYETGQLLLAAKIKACRQLSLSIEEIKAICSGEDMEQILLSKERELLKERSHIDDLLSAIHSILEEKEMNYQVTEKTIGKALVYSSETVLNRYEELMEWIPAQGEECLRLNPGIKCAEPPYEFCEFLDKGYKEKDIRVRHSEAVTSRGTESETIHFREIPETRVLSVYHKGAYETISKAYAYVMNYAEQNSFRVSGCPRECYIDGIWNKDDPADWLTEIQLPVE